MKVNKELMEKAIKALQSGDVSYRCVGVDPAPDSSWSAQAPVAYEPKEDSCAESWHDRPPLL